MLDAEEDGGIRRRDFRGKSVCGGGNADEAGIKKRRKSSRRKLNERRERRERRDQRVFRGANDGLAVPED